MTAILLRPASLADAPAILDIYTPYVLESTWSFETQAPDPAEFVQRMQTIMDYYPYLVVEVDSRTVGYAYAHRHKERAAYRWNVEFSAYLNADHTRRGLGKKLLLALLEISKLQKMHNVYSYVTLPNPASQGLQKSLGFRCWGVMEKTGYKFGKWLDVASYHKRIAPDHCDPEPSVPFRDLPAEQIASILRTCAAG